MENMNHKDFLTPGSWNLTSNNSRNIHKTRLLSFIAIFFVALIFILKAKTLSPHYYWYIFAAAITADHEIAKHQSIDDVTPVEIDNSLV